MARGFKLVERGEGPLRDRFRPQRLSEIVPTFKMKEAQAILNDPNASQVYLFEGLTGCGKTTLARIISRACVCEAEEGVERPCLECEACKTMEKSPDFVEINVANFRGIESVRDKIAGMCAFPGWLKRRIYIFDEAHQLSPASQELMNKVLEEPVGDTLIFLCTTNLKGLKRTLLGRCARLNFRRLTRKQLESVTKQVLGKLPSESLLDDIFMRADGSVRDLMNLLDKVALGTYEEGLESDSYSGIEGAPNIFKLVEAYKAKDWDTVRALLNTDYVKNEPDGYRETICTFLVREALRNPTLDMRVASVLGHLGGSLWEEPKKEQFNLLVLRSMRACYKKT